MKKTNKIVAMLLAAVSILSLSAMAFFSPEEAVVDRALEEVTGLYTDVYSNVMLKNNTINVVNFGLFIKKYNFLWEYCIM